MPEPATDKAPAGAPLDKAADRLRDSAKWLVAAFGAVAAVVFAGLTVADLGAVTGHRLTIALIGATVAIAGIIAALSMAMRLAGASTTSLDDLTRTPRWWEPSLKETQLELAKDPTLRTWDGKVADFVEDYRTVYDEYIQRAGAFAKDPHPQPDQSRLRKAFFHLEVMSAITERLLGTTGFLRLQRSFLRARIVVALLMTMAAAGAVAFGWATSGVPADVPNLPRQPIAGTLRPDESAVNELNRQVGTDCEFAIGEDIRIIALSADTEAETMDIVTVPEDGCAPATASVPLAQVTED